MSLILPFKALRPSLDKASDVIAPPYDVLDSNEARIMAKDKPYSFLHISKPEIDLEEGIQFNDERVYKKGAENLKRFINEKVLYQDKNECIYIYEITLNNKTQTGFGCIASVEAYNKNIIKIFIIFPLILLSVGYIFYRETVLRKKIVLGSNKQF